MLDHFLFDDANYKYNRITFITSEIIITFWKEKTEQGSGFFFLIQYRYAPYRNMEVSKRNHGQFMMNIKNCTQTIA